MKHTPAIAFKERPFDGRSRVMFLDEDQSLTIWQIVQSQKDLPEGFAETCVAQINGEIIPRRAWRSTKLKPNPSRDVSLVFSVPLRGGGGGNKGAQIGTIAVLLVAAAVSGGALGTLGFGSIAGAGSIFAAGTVGASVAGAAIGLGGALAIAALAPPPSLSSNAASADSGGQARGAAALSGNALTKGGAIPRVIGTMRVFPALLTQPLIEIVGDNTVAEAIYGFAGPHAISSIKIGTTSADSIAELQTEIQEGLPNSPQVGLVQRQGFTDTTISVKMRKHDIDTSSASNGAKLINQANPTLSYPNWEGLTSRVAPDELWIHLSFPAGLGNLAGQNQLLPFRIRIRQTGATSWINLPEFHVNRYTAHPFQLAVKLMWQAAPAFRNVMPDLGGPTRAFYSVPTQAVAVVGSGGWTADSYFYDGVNDVFLDSTNVSSTTGVINMDCFTEKVQFYLNDATKFPKSGNWDVQIMRGQAVIYGNFVASAYSYSANVTDFFGSQLAGGLYQVQHNQTLISDTVNLSNVSSIWNSHPVPNPDHFTQIAVKVTNRSIDQLSVLASGYTYDWDGAGWNTLTTTSNPAPHFYDVLTGSLGGQPLPVSIVDSAAIVAWRTLCIANSYSVNAVIEGKKYPDVLGMIASCGFGRLAHNEKWTVIVDSNTSGNAPSQVFTPRNMKNFSWTRAFTRKTSGIRASYIDANGLQAETLVFDDPAKPDVRQLDQITYEGLTTQAKVISRAKFDLAQADNRFVFYKGTVDIESLVIQRGDLIGVQHDILDTYAGFARVKSINRSGGNVTGLVLDGTVPVITGDDIALAPDLNLAQDVADYGATTGIMIRLKGGGGIITYQIQAAANGDKTVVTFPTPFSDPGTNLDEDCLCTTGRLGSEYGRYKVTGIAPSDDMTATISFVDEAPQIWA